jgi:hypothetical protein
MMTPMMMMPVVMMPMVAMPAPVTVMPMVVTPVVMAPMVMAPMVVVPMMTPADLLRLQSIDLGLRDQGGLRGLHPRRHDLHRSGRRQRRGIGNADKRHSARGDSDRKFQNRTKLHLVFSLHVMSQDGEVRCVEMNGL